MGALSLDSSAGEARPRALLLQHDDAAGPGLIGEWLASRGFAAEQLSVPGAHALPDHSRYAVIAALGSSCCANDDLPWARSEEALLRAAHTAGTPVLGVCFGAQLLACALGGRVERESVCEIGWQKVRTRRPRLIDAGPWFQWHFDTLVAPVGAEVIAESDAGVEAFVSGNSLGLQFHPEVTPAIIADWTHVYRSELDAHAVSAEAANAMIAVNADAARGRAFRLLDRFAARPRVWPSRHPGVGGRGHGPGRP